MWLLRKVEIKVYRALRVLIDDSGNSGKNIIKVMEGIGKEGNNKYKHDREYDPHDHGD